MHWQEAFFVKFEEELGKVNEFYLEQAQFLPVPQPPVL